MSAPHNFIILAICVPKIIKIGAAIKFAGDLTKF